MQGHTMEYRFTGVARQRSALCETELVHPDGTRTMLRQALDRFITTCLHVFQQVGVLPEDMVAGPGQTAHEI
jgi:hypothetical protein